MKLVIFKRLLDSVRYMWAFWICLFPGRVLPFSLLSG